MIATFLASMFVALPSAPSPEALRAGVYVWAAIVGLLTSGVISIAKEARAAARFRA